MWAHLPILSVVLPLLCAPLAVLLGRRDYHAWVLVLVVNLITLLFATMMLFHTRGGNVMHYALGGWSPPWGIALRVDAMSALFVFLFAIVSVACVIAMRDSFAHELKGKRLCPIYAVLLISQAGFFGVVMTDDLFNIFVLLEMASLSGYALTAASGKPKALLSAYRYLIMGTTGAVFLLLGIGYIYLLTGTLNLSDLAERFQALPASPATLAGLAFIAIGLFLKMALLPLHLWLPGVYTHAPSLVVALFTAVSGKAALYLLLRLFFSVFAIQQMDFPMLDVLAITAFAAIIYASYIAFVQENVKTMMAYSSIANIGYIVLALSFASLSGVTAAVIYMLNHALIKSALFVVLACIVYSTASRTSASCSLRSMAGLAKHAPLLCAAFVIAGVSLIGVPLSAGFISKWYLLAAAFDAQAWLAVSAIIIGSAFSIAYVWRIVEALYFKSCDEDIAVQKTPPLMWISVWLLLGLSVYIGVNPGGLIDLATRIATTVISP